MSASYDWDYGTLLPGDIYDVAANETWLEERALAGYRVKKVGTARVYFVKAEPAKVRYRIQPMRKKKEKLDEERIELYRELGWEYVGSLSGVFHLWYCEDENAPELETDPLVQADGYRYLRRRLRGVAIADALIFAALVGVCFWATADGSTALRSALRDTLPLEELSLWITWACGIVLLVMQLVTMRRLLRKLEAGIPMERPKPYRKKQWLQRAMIGGLILHYVLYTVSTFWPVGNGNIVGWSAMEGAAPKAGTVYVDVTDLELPDDEVYVERVTTKVHELASCVTEVEIKQIHRVEPGYNLVTANAETTHYCLRFSFLVPKLIEDIQYAYRNWGPFEEVEAEGLDRFLVSSRKDTQIVIAAKGNEVLEVFYSGETDMVTQGDYFASLLA